MNTQIILHIPHSSTRIPADELADYVPGAIEHELPLMTDLCTDRLFDFPCEKIVFPFSRLFCDVERFREDAEESMSEIGMGLAYTRCSDGSVLRFVSAELRERILHDLYDPHHQKLENAVSNALDACGSCLILDCHSFHPVPLPYEPDQRKNRPDICIGTDAYHTPEDLAQRIVGFFSSNGFSVRLNSPYAGALVPMKYYRKEKRVRSVMIELNRSLYTQSEKRFRQLKATLDDLYAGTLAAL